MLQWMFIIWLGAFGSLGLMLFGSQMREFHNTGSTINALAALSSRVYNFDRSVKSLTSSAAVGWHLYCTVFFVAAFGSMKVYVSIRCRFIPSQAHIEVYNRLRYHHVKLVVRIGLNTRRHGYTNFHSLIINRCLNNH